AGASTGFATTLVTGDWSYIADVTLAHLNHVPAVLVILGIATFLFGVWLRLIAITWFMLGLSFFVGTFGGLVKIPELFNKLVPFENLSSMPVGQFNMLPFLMLLSIFAITYLLGLIGLRARNIDTK